MHHVCLLITAQGAKSVEPLLSDARLVGLTEVEDPLSGDERVSLLPQARSGGAAMPSSPQSTFINCNALNNLNTNTHIMRLIPKTAT